MLGQIDAPQQQQVLQLADVEKSLLRRQGGGKQLDRRQAIGLLAVGGEDLGHVAQLDHRPFDGALRPQAEFGRRRDASGPATAAAAVRNAAKHR